ncbi:MAG: NAD(P)-dependent oxidoreductase [Pseudomonadota bacterium]
MPRQFQALPVLESLVENIAHRLDGVMVVATQHLLETTGSLIEALTSLGVAANDIHLIGKRYSTNADVRHRLTASGVHVYENCTPRPWQGFADAFTIDIEQLWRVVQADLANKAIHTLIVLDDGGRCLSHIPPRLKSRIGEVKVVGVEQTTSGLQNGTGHCPLIRVADAAAKKYLESPLVAAAVFDKLRAHLDAGISQNPKFKYGVIGMGSIGKAIADYLDKIGLPFYVYDRNPDLAEIFPANWCHELTTLLSQSDVVFSCTGEDVFQDLKHIEQLQGDRTFISCSSEDREFLSILKRWAWRDAPGFNPLDTIQITLPQSSLTLFRGGFPVNFDGSEESVPAADIQLTRGLLLSAVIQAAANNPRAGLKSPCLMLDPTLQAFVVREWRQFKSYPMPPLLIDQFNDLAWITKNSGGMPDDGNNFTIPLKKFPAGS